MKLKSNLTYVYVVGKNYIMPGLNYIEDVSILDHPHVQGHIEHNNLELLSDLPKKNGAFGKVELDYANMNAKELAREIKEIYDLKLLEKIQKNDTRKLVLDAVEKQLQSFREEDGE
jgi:hypothetical protein